MRNWFTYSPFKGNQFYIPAFDVTAYKIGCQETKLFENNLRLSLITWAKRNAVKIESFCPVYYLYAGAFVLIGKLKLMIRSTL